MFHARSRRAVWTFHARSGRAWKRKRKRKAGLGLRCGHGETHGGAGAPAAELALRRRLPPRLPRRPGDVYVNMQTDFKAQLSRCQKLLGPGGGCAEIWIHGLGLAINRAINIALQLQAGGAGALRLAANTSTVPLTDGLEPEGDEDGRPPLARARNNSAIHIRCVPGRAPALSKGPPAQSRGTEPPVPAQRDSPEPGPGA